MGFMGLFMYITGRRQRLGLLGNWTYLTDTTDVRRALTSTPPPLLQSLVIRNYFSSLNNYSQRSSNKYPHHKPSHQCATCSPCEGPPRKSSLSSPLVATLAKPRFGIRIRVSCSHFRRGVRHRPANAAPLGVHSASRTVLLAWLGNKTTRGGAEGQQQKRRKRRVRLAYS